VVSESERQALYEYLQSPANRLTRDTMAQLGRSPILLDHMGKWTAPKDITLRSAPDANVLTPVLHLPHVDYEGNERLMKAFSFRRKISGEDLMAYAKHVSTNPALASEVEKLFTRQIALLTESIVGQLRTISFLESRKGHLCSPNQVYVSNALIRSCVGMNADFVAGTNNDLYTKLKCLDKPKSEDIVDHLEERRNQPDFAIYKVLVEALRKEGKDLTVYRDRRILWHGTGFSCPKDTILGNYVRPIFMNILPQASPSGEIYSNYKSLGASTQPQLEHWHLFFEWFNERCEGTKGKIRGNEIVAMKGAYGRLSTEANVSLLNQVKQRFTSQSWCLLDRNGILHQFADSTKEKIVIDDDPLLATACEQEGLPLAFADSDENTLPFYESLGLKRLTGIRRVIGNGTDIGEELIAPSFSSKEMLANIKRPAFVSAIAALAAHEASSRSDSRLRRNVREMEAQLQGVEAIIFCRNISRNYRVQKKKVQVQVDHIVEKKRFVLQLPKSKRDFIDQMALCISEMLFPNDIRVFSDWIYRLLELSEPEEIKYYLSNRGIPWNPPTKRRKLIEDEEPKEPDVLDSLNVALSGLVTPLTSSPTETPIRPSAPPSPSVVNPTSNIRLVPPDPLPPEPSTLPDLSEVKPRLSTISSTWGPKPRTPSEGGQGAGRGTGTYRPPTLTQTVRNQEVGTRGEQIVYQKEVERVTEAGLDTSRVIWQSKHDPGSPYDIQSVGEDGTDIWIEVKATTGRDGRFTWSMPEFRMALEKRTQYHLVRVYEANSITPTLRYFQDPLSFFAQKRMQVDIADFHAEVEPLAPDD
jgi:hypothetical protein